MVNVPGRSKGCSTCRQRKLKCDESTPECLQCVKKGLQCPGPRTGAIFIHALPSQSQAVCSIKGTPGNISCQKAMTTPYQTVDDRLVHSLLPSSYQPSRAEMFDQLFVSHFIESFAFKEPSGRQPPTWLDSLAELIVSPTYEVVKHSIRASSALFYGSLAQDVAIQTEASRWYLKALQGLQYHLSQQLSSSFSGDVICAAVMLTHFESLADTAPGAWFQHVRGASLMVARGGPESCRQGFLHNIFRHLRLLTAVSSLFRNEQHPFSTTQWMTVPFEKLPKGPFDELVDVYFSLLPCLAIADEMIAATGEEFYSFRAELSTMVHHIITHLHTWWSQCAFRMDLNQANPKPNTPVCKKRHIDTPSDPYDIPLLPHMDMPSAALSALFDAANVIVFRLLSLVSSSAHIYEYRIQQHIQSIVSALEFVTNMPRPVSQRGFIMVALPLRIIQIWAPCSSMEIGDDTARPLVDKWAQDATSSAAPAEFFAHVAAYIHARQK